MNQLGYTYTISNEIHIIYVLPTDTCLFAILPLTYAAHCLKAPSTPIETQQPIR